MAILGELTIAFKMRFYRFFLGTYTVIFDIDIDIVAPSNSLVTTATL
jgi:hypothetical protein